MDYLKNPMGIEEKSFEIIGKEMGPHSFTDEELLIVKRTIHTTADFEYKDLVTLLHSFGISDKSLKQNEVRQSLFVRLSGFL